MVLITPAMSELPTIGTLESKILVPRDYQWEGIARMRRDNRIMNTDQPGLGKTLQAALAATKPCLVVAPTYLTQQWADFLKEQFPGDVVSFASKGRYKKMAAMRRKADWYVINKDALRTHEEYLPLKRVKTIIGDEAHHFRNRRAAQSRTMARICADMKKKVFLLTATPIWKQVDDLWMLLHIMQPGLFKSYNEFVEQFCIADETPYGPKVLGVRKSMRLELEILLDICRIGRTYSDVGRELPELIDSVVRVDFPDELRVKYNEVKNHFRLMMEEDEEAIFLSQASVMHTLRQITMFPGKIEAIQGLIEDTPGPHLVYTWYKDHAQLISDAIPGSVVVTGDVDPVDRKPLAQNASRAGNTVVATIASLSEGVDLSNCRSVIYAEENWPPGSNYQSLSRVRRDRNADAKGVEVDHTPVLKYCVHVPNTIDTVIHAVAGRREATARDVLRETLN